MARLRLEGAPLAKAKASIIPRDGIQSAPPSHPELPSTGIPEEEFRKEKSS